MATQTLEATTAPEVESPAKEEKKEEVEEDESKGGELDDKEEEGSGSKNLSVAPSSSSERPTRERKKVERFSLPNPTRAIPSKSVSIEKGRGTPLREIPNVAHQLSKRKADDNLILLHTILYGKKAKTQMIKKNIGQFSGFVWSEKEEEEKQRGRVKEKLDKCIKEKLIFFCDVLDIPINRSHIKKEEVAVKVLEFLESPKATRDVILADQEMEAKMRKSTPKKRKSGESSDTPAKKKRQTKKREHSTSDKEEGKDEGGSDSEGTKDTTHEEDDSAPEEEDSDHEKTETEDERDETEDEKPSDKKTSSKKIEQGSSGTKAKEKQASKKSGEKSSKRVAKPTSSPAKKQKVDHDESSKEKSKKQLTKPQTKGSNSKEKGKATKKVKAEPTREEMLEVVSKMLKEVDFNTATLSDILQKLSDHFGVDLSHRKKEVKGVITDAISEMSDVEDEESEAGSDKEKEEEEEKLED